MPSALDAFEELRFVWELFAAEALFLMPFARPRPHLAARLVAGLAGFSALSFVYFPWLNFMSAVTPEFLLPIGLWYVALTFAIMMFFRLCFEVSLPDALYVGIISFAAQHVVYVVVHELLALWLWTDLTQNLALYALLSLAACALWYGALYRAFSRRLSLAGGHLFEGDVRSALVMAALLCLFLSLTFGFQHLFHSHDANRPHAVWMSLVVCVIVLGLQYGSLQAVMSGRAKAALEQMLREASRHADLSRSLIDNVNRTVHDLKHTLRALEQVGPDERADYVNATSEYIKKYEMLVYSENEVLNTLLSEKALLCEHQNISFSCSIGSVDVGFIAIPDLYVLLGNVIDNAIEGVSKLSDPGKRAITLQVQGRAGLVLITCDNPFEGELTVRGGLPLTSKPDRLRHGYGLKSVRLVAEKYDGSLSVGAEDGIFTVQMAIPVP